MAGLAGVALALALVACGPPPPQPPLPDANAMSDSLSSIAQDCGEAFQVQEGVRLGLSRGAGPAAFGAPHPSLVALDSDASAKAHEMADVFRHNPEWNYQGETIRQIVALTISYLRECGLGGAAGRLQSEAR